ncbi:hypothetical protein Tco_1519905 [Tanacetum coccineum]
MPARQAGDYVAGQSGCGERFTLGLFSGIGTYSGEISIAVGVKDSVRTDSLHSDSHIAESSNTNSEIIPTITKALKEEIANWIKSDINVSKLSSKTDANVALKEFFNRTNGVRNAAYKELNAFEKNLDAKVKTELIYTNKDFKAIYNVEYPAVKKTYIDKDSYLRKKISEVLNVPKSTN